MRTPFLKMHGLGNDFVVIDARANDLPTMTTTTARRLASRREGIGCDQVIVLEPSVSQDFRMQIFNADGGEVESCGNASRAVALLHGEPAKVETRGGTIALEPCEGGARVDMGRPDFDWTKIPLSHDISQTGPVSWDRLAQPFFVNVGNPHAVFFIDDADAIDLAAIGPQIERDSLFPERINVNVASLLGEDHLKLRVWERGAGLTRACGTGACATAVAAESRGLVRWPVRVSLPGGVLTIDWDWGRGSIIMTGPAAESFRGSFEWDDFA